VACLAGAGHFQGLYDAHVQRKVKDSWGKGAADERIEWRREGPLDGKTKRRSVVPLRGSGK
jgi:hypothetical protein